MTIFRSTGKGRRGSALLTVLWISAALAAVSFALSNTVRGESERVSTDLDGIRAYYLAVGGVERAKIEALWDRWHPESRRLPTSGFVDYNFPTGTARVEVIPETAKLNLNNILPDRLSRMLAYMGVDQGQAQRILTGFLTHQTSVPGGASFSAGPTFPGAGASFQEIEELLAVPGMTPEILYGTYGPAQDAIRAGEGGLVHHSGLADCLSPYGSTGQVDVNGADPAVLAAVGVPLDGINLLVEMRKKTSIDIPKLGELGPRLGAGVSSLRVGGNSVFTFRATAGIRLGNGQLSEVRRTVAQQVKYMPQGFNTYLDVLRWYDTTWSN